MWDPHQNADPQNPNLLPVGSPTNFRIVPLQGAAALEVSGPGGNLPNFPTVPLDTTSYITFTRNNSASRTFADPTFLTLAFASSNKAVNMCPITHAAISGGVTQSAPGALQGNPGFVGFNAGLWPQPDQRLSGVATDPILNGMREPFPVDPSQWPIFALQAQVPSGDGSGAWHTIQVVEHLVGNDPGSEVMTWNPAFQYLATQIAVYNPDPRTERFGAFGGHGISNMGLIYNGVANSGAIQQNGPALGSAIQGTFDGVTGWLPAARHAYQVGAGGGGYPNVIVSSLALNNLASVSTAYNSYWVAYTDPDGILREGDATGYTVTAARARYPMIPDTGVSTTTHDGDRPVVLNRPYRSVGELGYAYRDMPWKTLDFFTKNSADGALLDLFTTSDAEVTAGRLDLNTRNVPVLQSMLASAITTELAPLGATAQLSLNAAPTVNSQAAALATTLVNWTTNKTDATQGPLLNRADLTRAFGSTDLGKPTTNQAINLDVKTQREVTVRALAESGVTRTWNLLIDIVAQAGHYPPGATTMDKFNVKASAGTGCTSPSTDSRDRSSISSWRAFMNRSGARIFWSLALLARLLPCVAAHGQGPAGKADAPQAPFLAKLPDPFHYEMSESPAGKEKRGAAKTPAHLTHISVSRAGDTRQFLGTYSNGKILEAWIYNGFVLLQQGEPLGVLINTLDNTFSDLPIDTADFKDLRWLSPETYQKIVTLDGKTCWLFENAPDAETTQAWVDVKTKLPAALVKHGITYNFQHDSAPSASLTLTPAFAQAWEKYQGNLPTVVASAPHPPYIEKLPDFARYEMLAVAPPGAKAEPAARDSTAADHLTRAVVTKTGATKQYQGVLASGKTTEAWVYKGLVLTEQPTAPRFLIGIMENTFSELPIAAGDFKDLEWVGAQTYTKTITYEGNKCYLFEQTTGEATAAQPWRAIIDLKTKLPVVVEQHGRVFRFQYDPPPAQELALSPDFAKAWQDYQNNLRLVRGRSPAR